MLWLPLLLSKSADPCLPDIENALTQDTFACNDAGNKGINAACRALNVQVIPYAAVAACLPEGAAHSHSRGTQSSNLNGLASCSLPVTNTGLPVHVNGAHFLSAAMRVCLQHGGFDRQRAHKCLFWLSRLL